MTGRLIIITGAQAAGKTTVGRAVAALLPRAVHIDGDAVHRFVVAGEVPMDLPPPPGAMEQLYLRYRGSLAVAQVYREAGFDAVFTDNIFGQQLTDVLAMVADAHIVMLDPSLETIRQRARDRANSGYTETLTPEMLVAAVRETPRIGLWVDSSDMTAEQTAQHILKHFDQPAIRERQPEDTAGCVAALTVVDGYPVHMPSDPAAWLTPSNVLKSWVAVDDTVIVGHVMVRQLRDGSAMISRLYVVPAAQGAGVGRRLLNTATAWTLQQGLTLTLNVDAASAAAVALYERNGWRRTRSELADWSTADGQPVTLLHYTLP